MIASPASKIVDHFVKRNLVLDTPEDRARAERAVVELSRQQVARIIQEVLEGWFGCCGPNVRQTG
jgi:hypothetical protein